VGVHTTGSLRDFSTYFVEAPFAYAVCTTPILRSSSTLASRARSPMKDAAKVAILSPSRRRKPCSGSVK
jgi:hypothetical protein